MDGRLEHLDADTPLVYGGDRVTTAGSEIAAAFEPGDALTVLQDSGVVLHLPAGDRAAARVAVDRAVAAFAAMGEVSDSAITAFFEAFADRLADPSTFEPIRAANEADVAGARARGRSTTRLVLSDRMRADMIAGLRGWAALPSGRGQIRRRIEHDGWWLEEVVDRLGVVGFVFEGRPNVFADATGVLRAGNTVVFRIGSDALGTARAIVEHALGPALAAAGLPEGAVSLVDSAAHAAGWAMFGDPRLALAVARGSGPAVAQLGAVARQAGNPVSLHGTGGAWIVADATADPKRFAAAVERSLDRKVCNTLNTLVVVAARADELVPLALEAADRAAAARDTAAKFHVTAAARPAVPAERFERQVPVVRADGTHDEPQAEPIGDDRLGHEWEWEDSPELTIHVVDEVADAIALFNAQAPAFGASLISADAAAHEYFFATVDAPFIGDGFTRWVDGQYALGTPELGLSNWEGGRLFGRSGVLSGDSVFTVRLRAHVEDPDLHR